MARRWVIREGCLYADCTRKHNAKGLCTHHLAAEERERRKGPWVAVIERPAPELMARVVEQAAGLRLCLEADREIVAELADELIRASCGTAHYGKGDVLTAWKQDHISAHERSFSPEVMARVFEDRDLAA